MQSRGRPNRRCRTKRMQTTARRLSVVSATFCARRRLICDVRLTIGAVSNNHTSKTTDGCAWISASRIGQALHIAEQRCSELGISIRTTDPKHATQRDMVQRLPAADADSVLRMRQSEPCISRISEALFATTYPSLTSAEITYLAARWSGAST